MISEKQEQANLQNAQLSTGPVTHEGKELLPVMQSSMEFLQKTW